MSEINDNISIAFDKNSKTFTIKAKVQKEDSKSGKSDILVSSKGNKKTGIMYEGKEVIIGLNMYIPKK